MPDGTEGHCLRTLNTWPCVLGAYHPLPHEAYNGTTWVLTEGGVVCGNQHAVTHGAATAEIGCMRSPGHLGEHRDRKDKFEARVVWD